MRLAVWGGLVAVTVAAVLVNKARHEARQFNERLCIYDCSQRAMPSWWPVWALAVGAVVVAGGCFTLRAVLLALSERTSME